MTKLRVSKRLVGEITLPVIETRTFSAGHIFSLTDEQMKNYAVQKAMKMGLLEEIKKEIPEEEVVPIAAIEDVSLDDDEDDAEVEDEIAEPVVEETKVVEEPKVTEVEKTEVPIEEKVEVVIVEPKENVEDKDFSTLNLDDIISRKDPEVETKTNMMSWDFEQQKSLEKNESSKTVMGQMNGLDMTVKTTKEDKNIDLDKKIEEVSSKIKVSTIKNNKIANNKTKSKSLKPVGKKKELLGDMMGDMSMPNEEQMFVDQEQTMEAILNHLVLKEKFANNENNNLQENET